MSFGSNRDITRHYEWTVRQREAEARREYLANVAANRTPQLCAECGGEITLLQDIVWHQDSGTVTHTDRYHTELRAYQS